MLTPARSFKKRVTATVRRAQQKYVVEKFNFIYYHGTGGAIPFTTTSWLGVDALKCPADMWIYQEILYKTRPDVVVECGVRFGGSTLYLAHLFDLMGAGQVIGCDITLENVHERYARIRESPSSKAARPTRRSSPTSRGGARASAPW